jgi:hypothetical protein
MPTLALVSDEVAEAGSDAAGDEAGAELPPPEAGALLEELFEHPTTPIASTAVKAMASSFLFMMVSPFNLRA